ncbi:MAG: hypothetical protein ABSD30_06060 [Candidatus Binatus sp.]
MRSTRRRPAPTNAETDHQRQEYYRAALPLSISTNYQTEASQFSCQVYGYTNSSNQLIVPATVTLGNCPTGAAPAPVTAPSGASTAAAH